MTIPGPDYQGVSIGTGATCYQTMANLSSGECGNFVAPRSLSINGQVMSCSSNWSSLPPPVNGGFCIYTTAGDQPSAYFTLQ